MTRTMVFTHLFPFPPRNGWDKNDEWTMMNDIMDVDSWRLITWTMTTLVLVKSRWICAINMNNRDKNVNCPAAMNNRDMMTVFFGMTLSRMLKPERWREATSSASKFPGCYGSLSVMHWSLPGRIWRHERDRQQACRRNLPEANSNRKSEKIATTTLVWQEVSAAPKICSRILSHHPSWYRWKDSSWTSW